MARYFNGISDYIGIADHAALTLGDDVDYSGPFSLTFWTRLGTMEDTNIHDFVSWSISARPTINVFTYGDNHAYAGLIEIHIEDVNRVRISDRFSTAINDNTWHHVLLVFDGTDFRAYLDNSLQFTQSRPTLKTIDVAGSWWLGRYYDDSTHFKGDMAEWAKWDSALSSEQRAALVAGMRPPEIGTRPAWYLPMFNGLDEEIAGLTAANVGTTISEHPPTIILPGIPHVFRTVTPQIGGPYQVAAAAMHTSGAAGGDVFSTGTTIGQINGY